MLAQPNASIGVNERAMMSSETRFFLRSILQTAVGVWRAIRLAFAFPSNSGGLYAQFYYYS